MTLHYVLSDIHGNKKRFQSVMEQISLRSEDRLYVLGDVIDRHPYGIEILRQLMDMPNVRMLLGNHEYMMLNALTPYDEALPWHVPESDRGFGHWFRNGGGPTRRAYDSLPKDEQKRIRSFLKELPLNLDLTVADRRFKLVHAAPVEWYGGKYAWDYIDETAFAVWCRIEDFSAAPDGETILFGHTPTMYFQPGKTLSIWHGNKAVGIDCGSGFPTAPAWDFPHQGRLACLRLEDGREFYSEESGEEESETE